ncbi:hypothetical protein Mpe_B0599 (plasmid) [Methylibium petroleiphilum PM1]|uniref:Uncharacterized protein n=1 Tax=Methylibium petroleiphilum (strain ATCC BAA-1232 / LMG 22953 / PM1) TaxID=420662 RepID=A2SP74_METPP|nr:hypothetical protein Mpe_B0599 [Methylibium petroleiphilum PM1]
MFDIYSPAPQKNADSRRAFPWTSGNESRERDSGQLEPRSTRLDHLCHDLRSLIARRQPAEREVLGKVVLVPFPYRNDRARAAL